MLEGDAAVDFAEVGIFHIPVLAQNLNQVCPLLLQIQEIISFDLHIAITAALPNVIFLKSTLERHLAKIGNKQSMLRKGMFGKIDELHPKRLKTYAIIVEGQLIEPNGL